MEPDSSRLFEVNSTFVVLHLDAWESGGCPVSYFVVQYRPDVHASARPSPSSSDWTLHSNNVVPQQQLVQLADLAPGTWYTLLMSAHNDAGSTEVELSFATLTLAGGKLIYWKHSISLRFSLGHLPFRFMFYNIDTVFMIYKTYKCASINNSFGPTKIADLELES